MLEEQYHSKGGGKSYSRFRSVSASNEVCVKYCHVSYQNKCTVINGPSGRVCRHHSAFVTQFADHWRRRNDTSCPCSDERCSLLDTNSRCYIRLLFAKGQHEQIFQTNNIGYHISPSAFIKSQNFHSDLHRMTKIARRLSLYDEIQSKVMSSSHFELSE